MYSSFHIHSKIFLDAEVLQGPVFHVFFLHTVAHSSIYNIIIIVHHHDCPSIFIIIILRNVLHIFVFLTTFSRCRWFFSWCCVWLNFGSFVLFLTDHVHVWGYWVLVLVLVVFQQGIDLCPEVLGCGSVGWELVGTTIMSVPGKVWSEVEVSGGAFSMLRISCAVSWVIGSLLAAADFCSLESILSPVDDCWIVNI